MDSFSCDASLGQVFTPDPLAREMVDFSGFHPHDLKNGRILDPACGDGSILMEVVRRIMALTPKCDWEFLFSQIAGWDIDTLAVEACKKNLTTLTGFSSWNIVCVDGLKCTDTNFEWVIANPPYIRIRDLDDETRFFLRTNFPSCRTGMVDLYIAFIEKIARISKNSLIICPSPVRTSLAAKALRQWLVQTSRIAAVYDHGHNQRFPNASVNTCYLKLRNNSTEVCFFSEPTKSDACVGLESLKSGESWVLNTPYSDLQCKFSDVADISVGIATLADKIFIVPLINQIEDTLIEVKTPIGNRIIEEAICRPVIKASKNLPFYLRIILPYDVSERGEHTLISEDYFQQNFPRAYSYLCEMREDLAKRDKGKLKAPAWYAFGRTQGLGKVGETKVAFSPIAENGVPFIQRVPAGTYYYSGYAVFPKPNLTIEDMETILESEAFSSYALNNGRKMTQGWVSLSKHDIAGLPVSGILDITALASYQDHLL